MATAPYGVRLLVGAAVTAIEETRKLPQTILMYPMTVASNIAHIVMKVQQDLADMVIKGDTALENIFLPKDEQPDWATFDEDVEGDDDEPLLDGERLTEGRFALYTVTDGMDTKAQGTPPSVGTETTSAPEIAEELDYESLTLAQLRARLQSLSVADLEALLAYEEASKARAPFQTLLANRITRASAK